MHLQTQESHAQAVQGLQQVNREMAEKI
jgi:hypothetical protein